MALLQLAWLNIQMDTQAKLKLLSTIPKDLDCCIPFAGWTCSIEGWSAVKNTTDSLCNHLNGKIIMNHWVMKERFSGKVTQTIDWECSEKALKGLLLAQQQWVAKMATKFLLDGKNMQCWGFHSKAQCPRCAHPMEDKEHIFKCPAESAHTQWNKSIAELNQWLQIAWTHLQIRKDIINSLQQWHGQIPGCRPYIEGSTAGLTQDNISWGLALEGCIAKRWQEEQDMFWKAIKSRKSSQRWTMALLNQLMMMAWDMWNHRNKALHEEKANKQAILEDAVNQKI